jgi:DNA mismatch repair protein MutH
VRENYTKQDVIEQSQWLINQTLRDLIPERELNEIEQQLASYGTSRKGFWGDLIEKYGYGIENDNLSSADFHRAGIELKSTPLVKNNSGTIRAKERLVFSMINYMTVVDETWETSSFLSKNRLLLVLFYLYSKESNLLDYPIKHFKFLDLLSDLSESDVLQIIDDWNHIVGRIKAGEAHLLSEGETAYLGAATKARNRDDTRPQPNSDIPAKKRAFSLKQSYLNVLVQQLSGKDTSESLNQKDAPGKTIRQLFDEKIGALVGKNEEELATLFEIDIEMKKPKNLRRLLVNRALGVRSNKITELIKANMTLKVIKLEESGRLVESISFPVFKYMEIIHQEWEKSDFYKALTERSFVFVIFRKQGGTSVLEGFKFWSFPLNDLEETERVWRLSIERIKAGQADNLPKIRDSNIAHVRPHARNAADTLPTPLNGEQVKKCFWLNAKYIENVLGAVD